MLIFYHILNLFYHQLSETLPDTFSIIFVVLYYKYYLFFIYILYSILSMGCIVFNSKQSRIVSPQAPPPQKLQLNQQQNKQFQQQHNNNVIKISFKDKGLPELPGQDGDVKYPKQMSTFRTQGKRKEEMAQQQKQQIPNNQIKKVINIDEQVKIGPQDEEFPDLDGDSNSINSFRSKKRIQDSSKNQSQIVAQNIEEKRDFHKVHNEKFVIQSLKYIDQKQENQKKGDKNQQKLKRSQAFDTSKQIKNTNRFPNLQFQTKISNFSELKFDTQENYIFQDPAVIGLVNDILITQTRKHPSEVKELAKQEERQQRQQEQQRIQQQKQEQQKKQEEVC